MSNDPPLKQLVLPSHHALLVRVLADIRRVRRRILSYKYAPEQDSVDLNDATAICYSIVMTLEMELSFIMRKAVTKLEEDDGLENVS